MRLASKFRLFPVLVAAILGAVSLFGGPPPRGDAQMPALQGENAVGFLKRQGTYASLTDAIAASRYRVGPVAGDAGGSVQAPNPQQRYHARFTSQDVQVTSNGRVAGSAEPAWKISLALTSYGYSAARTVVSPGVVTAAGNRVEIARPSIIEWFVNRSGGLEQGFTIAQRPSGGSAGERLRLELAVSGNLRARASADATSIALIGAGGGQILSYDHLVTTDASGRPLASHFEATGATVSIVVDDANAVYPVTIDPTIAQMAYLKASNTSGGDRFHVVAISGDTVVVGAPNEDSAAAGVDSNQLDNAAPASGAAYVFVRTAGTWSQQAYLKASNTGSGDLFGTAVAISGDTIVIGAPSESSNATAVNGDQTNDLVLRAGAAYVFIRAGATWSQQAYLKGPAPGSNDRFGHAVGLSEDSIVVGAPGEGSGATGVNGDPLDSSMPSSGAAYVFVRNGVAWNQEAYLKASNTGAFDFFGHSVGISGDTVVVGAHQEASKATGVNGDQTNDLLSKAGAAYAFGRSDGTWSQQAYLKASNTGPDDQFGISVAVSGQTIVVGAPFEDSNATGVNGDALNNLLVSAGSAYVFVQSGATWSQQAYLKSSNGTCCQFFGWSVAISGDAIVVGAERERGNGTGVNPPSNTAALVAGAAYVFQRTETTWAHQVYLKASNTDAGDAFGHAVAIDGATAVIGARDERSGSTGINGDQTDNSLPGSGAVYVFAMNLLPVASAGADQTVEALSSGATAVSLDGSASSDADGDSLTYTWRDAASEIVGTTAIANVSLALGTYSYTLTVSDGQVTSTDNVTVIVQDTVGPSIAIAAPASGASYSFSQVVAASYSCADVASTTVTCGGSAANGAPVDTSSAGTHAFTVTATDSLGNESSVTFEYTVTEPAPSVTSLSHPSCTIVAGSLTNCPVAGGGTLTILGSGFGVLAASPVTVSDGLCAGPAAHVPGFEDTRLTCTLAAAAAGTTRHVSVTSAGGTSAGSGVTVTNAAVPTISSVSHPACVISGSGLDGCPVAGGGTLTILGTNFGVSAGSISVGPVCSGSVTWVSSTALTCTLAPGAAGTTAAIAVTTNGGTTLGSNASYAPVPTLAALEHSACAGSGTTSLTGCPVGGGGTLTMSGTGFIGPSGTITATGGICLVGTVTVISPTHLTCTLSAGTTMRTTSVVTNGGQSPTATLQYNDAPTVAANAASIAVDEGGTAANAGTYSDTNVSDTVAMTASVGTIAKTGTNTGTWSWSNPAPNGPDTYAVTITANDGTAAPVTTSFNVTVNNTAPVASAQSLTTLEDAPRAITLSASDAGNDLLSFTIVAGPAHGLLSGDAPNLTYTPAANYHGADSFTFKASDGLAESTTVAVTIALTPVNDAPVAQDHAYATNDHTAASGNVLADAPAATDIDADVLTATLVGQTAHGTVIVSANGGFTYQPNGHFAGVDSFTFRASDAESVSNVATVRITITDATPPVFTGVPADFTVNATSPAGAAASYATPAATDAIDGAVATACVPVQGTTLPVGTTTVTCTASDTTGHASQVSFVITVQGPTEILEDLSTTVAAILSSVSGTSLGSKVESVEKSLASGNTAAVKGQLKALANEARAQSGKKLTTEQATAIISLAEQMDATIGG